MNILSIPTDTFLTLNMPTPAPKLSARTIEHIHQIREKFNPAFHPLCTYLREDCIMTDTEHKEINNILGDAAEEHYTHYYTAVFDLTSFLLAEAGEL